MFHADTFPSFPSVSSTSRRVCVLACIGVLVASLTACSAPRIAGRAEAELQPSPCEKAYADATANADIMADRSRHIIMRYLAAQEAVSDWANTAAYCPARFADGTLRSAQARHTARLMAARLTINIAQPTLSRCDGIDSFDIDADSLSAMSVAEDQAGFAMEVFAARSIGHATLDISDRHKTTSQRLISFSGAEDTRAKTYDVAQLLAHPDTIVDSATGLFAPTDAVIEMNCARSEIAAVESSSNSTSDSAQPRTTAENSSDDSRQQSLGILTSMIADRVDLALTWGYPSFDEALFE